MHIVPAVRSASKTKVDDALLCETPFVVKGLAQDSEPNLSKFKLEVPALIQVRIFSERITRPLPLFAWKIPLETQAEILL
jgi:hypothetical protein